MMPDPQTLTEKLATQGIAPTNGEDPGFYVRDPIAAVIQIRAIAAPPPDPGSGVVLHLHVREPDGKGSKRLSMFNELIAGVRARVPEMVIQVGGSISFAPEDDGSAAKWLSDDTRHMLAELDSEARPGDCHRQHDADECDGACRHR